MGCERLYGSPTVVVWSQGIRVGRAKIAMGAEIIWVYCSREIAVGSVGISGGRAKVSVGCVMLVGSRKIAHRYVMIGVSCSADYCRLFLPVWRALHTGLNLPDEVVCVFCFPVAIKPFFDARHALAFQTKTPLRHIACGIPPKTYPFFVDYIGGTPQI